MQNILRCFLLILITIFSNEGQSEENIITPSILEQLMQKGGFGFANLEHRELGESIILRGLQNTNAELTLPNGIKVTYGEIVMLAGDLFGNAKYPISSCSLSTPQNCFEAQFNALALVPKDKVLDEIKQLRKFFADLALELKEARNQGQDDWVFYKKKGNDITKKLNRLTGGGSFISDYIPFGQYILLAQVNYDHFVPDSLKAYQVGHQMALKTALRAHQLSLQNKIEEADKTLQLAYAQNAFANHYLTDSLSSGHMRTPRRAVAKIHLPAVLTLLIANLMHDEDSQQGLWIFNSKGMNWLAYGDGNLYKKDNKFHYELIKNIMQLSADSIYKVFKTGAIPNVFPEQEFLPLYDQIGELNNTSPLFKLENGKLLKRESNFDLWDYHWTGNWVPLVTLLEFQIKNK
ncbi:phospholipase C [Legionella busanensis]|uniref:Phospholipase C n=1 Tax=Legionella busanensis TaxID=190655 RepID=A0A378KCU3_9GAMM|nr:phospholipase [Legionella busanensis]STX81331.1 phospholipase C [Legionella busanensis]